MIPLDKVKKIVSTYETLEKDLASSNIDKKDFVKKSKEYSNIGDIINEAKSFINYEKEKTELENIIEDKNGDKDMIDLAKSELNQLTKQHKEYEKKYNNIKINYTTCYCENFERKRSKARKKHYTQP